jgi:glycine C-acetyltransferase
MTSTKTAWIGEEIARLKEQGLFTNIRTLGSPQGAWLVVDGKRVLNFSSNNYLGLANHPRLLEAAKQAMDQYGLGPAAVRTIAGTMDLHLRLEQRLAAFKGVEAAITFQSGFTANLATIPALVGKGDVIFSDRLNHASDVTPLPALTEIANEYDILLMVDDAHGEGVLGKGGRGIVDHFDLHGNVDVEVGTLSKAFGAVGGVVAGKKDIVDWLRQRGRPFLFSSAMTVPDVAACLAAVDLLEESTELVDRLWSNAAYFKKGMNELGFNTGHTETPIVPVMLGEAPLAQQFSKRLFDEDVFAMAIGFPTVPQGKARIRVMNSATHSKADLDQALGIFARVGRELGVIR